MLYYNYSVLCELTKECNQEAKMLIGTEYETVIKLALKFERGKMYEKILITQRLP